MSRPFSRPLLWLFVAALTGGVLSHAEEPAAQLHVATAATTFHIGERISLELDFTASPDAHLAMTTAAYDRSGRMNYESFEVSPTEGFSDPLAAYFSSGMFMGGGLFGVEQLSSKPYTMHLNLNEWVRFDSPGDYTVTVHSSRVFSPRKGMFSGEEPLVTSNPVKLHIIAATSEWQKATLARAVQVLAVKQKPNAPVPEETQAAIADIRFLGSAEAIQVMAERLGDDQPASAFALGLAGVPPSMHDLAIRTLRERIEDPEVGVSGWLMTALSALESGPSTTWKDGMAARSAAQDGVVRLVIRALPRKTGKAKAETADLLAGYSRDLTAMDKASIGQALAASFTELPEEKQAALLEYQWGLLKPGVSSQTLEQIASLPVQNAGSREFRSYNRGELKSSALRRWYELDPEAAKRAAFAQIGSEKPSLTAEQVWFLPTEPLPQFEPVWAQALLSASEDSNVEVLAGLMTRFGTGAFASEVADKARASLGKEACAPQAAMIAYVVKFNNDLARPLVDDAIATRTGTACYRELFRAVAQDATGPALTDAAMKSIGDAEPQVAMDAVEYLATYGDKRSQPEMLNRYEAWAQEWAGRGDELEAGDFVGPSPNGEQRELGRELGHALLVNQGWITDDKLRSEVLKGCVGEQMCRSLQQDGSFGVSNVVTASQMSGRESIHVGPYEIPNLDLLKAKLSQYPRGTAFQFIKGDPSIDKQFETQVRSAFEDAGMNLSGGS